MYEKKGMISSYYFYDNGRGRKGEIKGINVFTFSCGEGNTIKTEYDEPEYNEPVSKDAAPSNATSPEVIKAFNVIVKTLPAKGSWSISRGTNGLNLNFYTFPKNTTNMKPRPEQIATTTSIPNTIKKSNIWKGSWKKEDSNTIFYIKQGTEVLYTFTQN
jgi:hypothetical protein